MSPTAAELEAMDSTKEALQKFLGGEPKEFDARDLHLLASAGYTSVRSFQAAKSEVFEGLGLRPGPKGLLQQATAPAAGGAAARSTAGGVGGAAVRSTADDTGGLLEGKRNAPYLIERTDFAQRILLRAYHSGAVLVKAPPESGKTTSLELILEQVKWLRTQYPDVDIEAYFISMLRNEEPDVALRRGTHNVFSSWKELGASPPSSEGGAPCREKVIILVIDEAQNAYRSPQLFEELKLSGQNSGGKRHLRFVMAAAYGPDSSGYLQATDLSTSVASSAATSAMPASAPHYYTPFKLPSWCIVTVSEAPLSAEDKADSTNALPSLSVTPDEFNEMRQLFAKKHSFALSDEVASEIYNRTAGQVGLIVRCFLYLAEQLRAPAYQSLPPDGREAAVWYQLRSDGLLASLMSARSVVRYKQMTSRQQALINRLLDNGYLADPAEEDADAVRQLLNCGVIVPREPPGLTAEYHFSSPVHAQLMAYWVYRSDQHIDDFYDFLLTALRRMDPVALKNTVAYTLSTQRPYEYVYQFEFYKAGSRLLPRVPGTGQRAIMSPSAGKVHGARGFLDFYVPALRWGFELLRDGDQVEQHLARFKPGGAYFKLVQDGYLKHCAVLDFRSELTPFPDLERPQELALFHVCFSAGYTRAKILAVGQQPVEIAIGGDRS